MQFPVDSNYRLALIYLAHMMDKLRTSEGRTDIYLAPTNLIESALLLNSLIDSKYISDAVNAETLLAVLPEYLRATEYEIQFLLMLRDQIRVMDGDSWSQLPGITPLLDRIAYRAYVKPNSKYVTELLNTAIRWYSAEGLLAVAKEGDQHAGMQQVCRQLRLHILFNQPTGIPTDHMERMHLLYVVYFYAQVLEAYDPGKPQADVLKMFERMTFNELSALAADIYQIPPYSLTWEGCKQAISTLLKLSKEEIYFLFVLTNTIRARTGIGWLHEVAAIEFVRDFHKMHLDSNIKYDLTFEVMLMAIRYFGVDELTAALQKFTKVDDMAQRIIRALQNYLDLNAAIIVK